MFGLDAIIGALVQVFQEFLEGGFLTWLTELVSGLIPVS